MLNEVQREQKYALQEMWRDGRFVVRDNWEPTPAQARRLRKKANKAKGDSPRSRKQRWIRKLRSAIEEKRKSLPEAQPDDALDILSTVDDTAGPEIGSKPLCPTCEPVAPDWACRTKSGKKTRDHAGRVRF